MVFKLVKLIMGQIKGGSGKQGMKKLKNLRNFSKVYCAAKYISCWSWLARSRGHEGRGSSIESEQFYAARVSSVNVVSVAMQSESNKCAVSCRVYTN